MLRRGRQIGRRRRRRLFYRRLKRGERRGVRWSWRHVALCDGRLHGRRRRGTRWRPRHVCLHCRWRCRRRLSRSHLRRSRLQCHRRLPIGTGARRRRNSRIRQSGPAVASTAREAVASRAILATSRAEHTLNAVLERCNCEADSKADRLLEVGAEIAERLSGVVGRMVGGALGLSQIACKRNQKQPEAARSNQKQSEALASRRLSASAIRSNQK